MNLTEKQINSKYIFKGRVINLRQDNALLPDGQTANREVIEHPGGVGVIALTENSEILMVRQYRYPYSEVTLEIPAGKRDPGEDPFITGQRELKEETGASAATYLPLGTLYPTPGYCDEIIWIYAAKDLTFGETNPDSDEFLEAEKIPLEEAYQMVMNGTLKDSKTQIAILKLYNLVNQGQF